MPADPTTHALVQAWVPRDVAAKLRDRANRNDRSIAAETRQAIRNYLTTSEAAGQGGSANHSRMAVRNDPE